MHTQNAKRLLAVSALDMEPATIVADAQANGFGWLAWAWDDGPCPGNNYGFSMTNQCSKYTGLDSELTTFGKGIVPLFQGAKRANLH